VLYSFEATRDYFISLRDISTLSGLAAKGDENRMLFLKLSVVSLVTKFQVYVEKVLKEALFRIVKGRKPNRDLPLHIRLNSIRIFAAENNLPKKLENQDDYGATKQLEVNQHVSVLLKHCDDHAPICDEYCLNTKFPLGKTGMNELLDLFKQFEGNRNIFQANGVDIEKLNALLHIRHNIIHQDANPAPLTEVKVKEDIKYLRDVVLSIDKYLGKFCV